MRAVRMTSIREKAYRILFMAGLFDPAESVPWTAIGLDQYGAESHRQLAYEAALQSVVLLVHDNSTLPLGNGGGSSSRRSNDDNRNDDNRNAGTSSTSKRGFKLAILGPQADNRGGVQGADAKGGETGSSGGLCGGYRGAVCPPGPDGKSTMACIRTIRDVLTAANHARGGTTTYAAGVPRQSNGRLPATQGTWEDNFNISGVSSAAKLAEAADVAVVVLGIDTFMEGEGNDRLNTSLSPAQIALGKAVLETGTPTVFVISNGGAVSLDPLVPAHAAGVGHAGYSSGGTRLTPAAVVEAGYLCDNNQALADLLFGVENRWGKLAYTIYPQAFALHENPMPTASECGCEGTPATYRKCVECSIGYLNMSMQASVHNGNPGRGHRYYSGQPQFPFGFGLSLTSFNLAWHHDDGAGEGESRRSSKGNVNEHGRDSLSAPSLNRIITARHGASGTGGAEFAEYTVKVTNTGPRSGDEVVFMYCQPASKHSLVLPASGLQSHVQIPTPTRKLVGFERVRLDAGTSTTVSFSVGGDGVSLVDADGGRWIVEGNYTVVFTNGAREILQASLQVHASAARHVRSLPASATAGML